MQEESIYRAARLEASSYASELAERMGAQFEESAPTEWNRDHWWSWAADRVVQHITGEVFWAELSKETFASVSNETPERQEKLDQLTEIRNRLQSDGLMEFAEREDLFERWAELVNRLLD